MSRLQEARAVARYREMGFPLNVYAHALYLDGARVDYLHYGLFSPDRADIGSAQRHSTELVLAKLPPPPCRLLEVGIGFGTMLALLRARGYAVHGVTPDPQQVESVRATMGRDAPVTQSRFEEFEAAAGSFDAILFQESSQYVAPQAIFDGARHLLVDGGCLLIVDEFALRRDPAGTTGLAVLEDFIAFAQGSGFELRERIDLSAQAAPTLDYLLQVTARHRQQLIDDLALTAEQLDGLDESNREYRRRYADGHYGYALLRFARHTMRADR